MELEPHLEDFIWKETLGVAFHSFPEIRGGGGGGHCGEEDGKAIHKREWTGWLDALLPGRGHTAKGEKGRDCTPTAGQARPRLCK